MNLINFENCEPSGISYGGHSGSKKGIILNNERWFLKFPKYIKSKDEMGLSYTTAPLSEYLGSKIYESIGIDVHKVKLGILDNKLVVACQDFLSSTEVIIDYNALKNEYDEKTIKIIEEYSSVSSKENDNSFEELLIVMNNNPYFKKIPELITRFWTMFIIDGLLANNDRNDGNWGLILDKETGKVRLAPVFDNGASFNNKSSDERLLDIYNDEDKFNKSAYESIISIFKIDNHPINPIKFIEDRKNKECLEVCAYIISKIDLEKIKSIIYDLPESYNGIKVISKIQKDFYYRAFCLRLNKIKDIINVNDNLTSLNI